MENDVTQAAAEKHHFVDDRARGTDNLHSGDFLSGQQLAMAGGVGGAVHERTARAPRPGAPGTGGADSSLPELIFLKQQGDPTKRLDQINGTADKLAQTIMSANKSIDVAMYHFTLTGDAEKKVVGALNDRVNHGVAVHLDLFNEPNEKDPSQKAVTMPHGLDPKVGITPIDGGGHLEHNKFMVIDNNTPNATVWTGSTNWTDDAFGDQDNNIVILKSPELAAQYTEYHDQMENAGKIAGTGKDLHKDVQVGDSTVTVAFAPGDGNFIEQELAQHIQDAKATVHIVSMDLTNKAVLTALAAKIDGGTVKVDGMYDGAQMKPIASKWAKSQDSTMSDLWTKVEPHLVAKTHAPFPNAMFMHDKFEVVDENLPTAWVETGSFNISSNAKSNGENTLAFGNGKMAQDVAQKYAAYATDLENTYRGGKKAN